MKILILANEVESTQKLRNEAERRGHEVKRFSPRSFKMEISESEKGYDKIFYWDGQEDKRLYLKDYNCVINRHNGKSFKFGQYLSRQFQNMGFFITNIPYGCGICTDKFKTHQILSKDKIGNPTTLLADRLSDFSFVGKRLGLPLLQKNVPEVRKVPECISFGISNRPTNFCPICHQICFCKNTSTPEARTTEPPTFALLSWTGKWWPLTNAKANRANGNPIFPFPKQVKR